VSKPNGRFDAAKVECGLWPKLMAVWICKAGLQISHARAGFSREMEVSETATASLGVFRITPPGLLIALLEYSDAGAKLLST
jgi:hypothetical protein